MALSVNKPCGS